MNMEEGSEGVGNMGCALTDDGGRRRIDGEVE